MVVLSLLAWTVLGKVLGSPHDELHLVQRVSHGARFDGLMEESIGGGEMEESLIVQVGVHHALELARQLFQRRPHDGKDGDDDDDDVVRWLECRQILRDGKGRGKREEGGREKGRRSSRGGRRVGGVAEEGEAVVVGEDRVWEVV